MGKRRERIDKEDEKLKSELRNNREDMMVEEKRKDFEKVNVKRREGIMNEKKSS